ncbi:MAG: aspartate carbamoyltransferase regulatory subunit [Bacillota bacterium]|nr:aspartate carbamoyltransferase regulatory subunit [Bacillota bacterium]
MTIDSIKNGIVIDHIQAGKSMEIYRFLNLESLDCSVAIIKNVASGKMGKKDIIKIDSNININLDVLGYIDPDITVNIIQGGVRVDKHHLELPAKITNVIFCQNPRCITSVEQEIPHIFKLTDRKNRVYRCIYCESKAKEQN